MGIIYTAVGAIAGSILGFWLLDGSDTGFAFGLLAGAALGILAWRQQRLRREIDSLRRQLEGLVPLPTRVLAPPPAAASAPHPPIAPPRPAAAGAPPFGPSPSEQPPAGTPPGFAVPPRAAGTGGAPTPPPALDPSAASAPPPFASPVAAAAGPSVETGAGGSAGGGAKRGPRPAAGGGPSDRIRRFLAEGNLPVKVGVLVLFAGVAALLRYAADEGWLRFPIELRLAGVALLAMIALAFGYRQRIARRTFGLSLQGGAIGILLLTVFAAFRLYRLVPAPAALAMMLVLVAGTGLLAVLQDALALAVLGTLAGFLAPILVSTGSDNHVALFGWYTILDLLVLAVAWKKAWRPLNLVGFVSTFAIATAWGALRYDPGRLPSTLPFVAVFFAIYLAVPILFARGSTRGGQGLVDGSLVFGTPLATFGLLALLLEGKLLPLALAALCVAASHLLVALALRRREAMQLLATSHAVVAVAFATVAVPLALDAKATASIIAAEGAALIWLGLAQRRKLAWAGGAALLALGALFWFGHRSAGGPPLANGTFLSALLLAAAGFVAARLHQRRSAERFDPHDLLAAGFSLFGLAFWIAGWFVEIDRHLAGGDFVAGCIALAAATALLASLLRRRMAATVLDAATALLLAPGAAWLLLQLVSGQEQPFAGWGGAAWAFFAAAGGAAVAGLRGAPGLPLALAHHGWLWSLCLAIGIALRQAGRDADLGEGWLLAALALPLFALHGLALLRPRAIAWPVGERFSEGRRWLLGEQMAAMALAACWSLGSEGDARPLPYWPLLNPQDLVALGWLALLAIWSADPEAPRPARSHRLLLLAVAGFFLVSAATLRSAAHFGDLARGTRLFAAGVAQTSLSVVWSLLGVAGWVVGSRRSNRPLWLAGAVLMALVLAKLALIDRQHLGNLAGIVSFLAYGLLCTLVGYLAPAPPRAEARAADPGPPPFQSGATT